MAVAAALGGQAFVVHADYGGDWSALFFLGDDRPTPDLLAGLPGFRHPDTAGYDGQFYRLLAYDPLQLRTPDEAFDDSALRRRRILTSAAAWAFALGSRQRVDGAYQAVVLLMLGAGVWFACRLAEQSGFSAAWGLLFVLAPGVLVSLERMTVDISLAAATVAFAWGVQSGRRGWVFAALAAAPLFRETGLALTAGWCAWALLERRWKDLGAGVVSALPFVAWAGYVASISGGLRERFLTAIPLSGLVRRTFEPYPDPAVSAKQAVAAGLEHLAIAGVWLLLGTVVWWAVREGITPLTAAGLCFAAGIAMVGREGMWAEAYAFGRVVTPLALLTAAGRPGRAALLPWALILPRILAQLGTHLL